MRDYDIWLSDKGPPLPDVVNNDYRLCCHRTGNTGSGVTDILYCDVPTAGRFLYFSINTTSAHVATVCELQVFAFGEWSLYTTSHSLHLQFLKDNSTIYVRPTLFFLIVISVPVHLEKDFQVH